MTQRLSPPRTIAVSTYDQGRAILRSKSFRAEDFAENVAKIQNASGLDLQDLIDRLEETPFFAHGPKHLEMRRRMAGFFAPRAIARWNTVIERIVDDVLTSLVAHDEVEVVDEIIEPIILKMRIALFGINKVGLDATRRWDEALVRFFMPLPSLRTFKLLQKTYEEVCTHAATAPQVDFADRLPSLRDHLEAPQPGLTPISDRTKETLIAINVMATYAANGTLSNIITEILSSPEGLAQAQDVQWLEANVDDLIRLGGAPREILRCLDADEAILDQHACPVFGQDGQTNMRRGDMVRLSIEQINRDASVFGEHATEPNGKTSEHLSFGAGVHICPGAGLTRLLTKCVLAGLARHLPSLKLSTKRHPRQKQDSPFRAFDRIPCSLVSGHV